MQTNNYDVRVWVDLFGKYWNITLHIPKTQLAAYVSVQDYLQKLFVPKIIKDVKAAFLSELFEILGIKTSNGSVHLIEVAPNERVVVDVLSFDNHSGIASLKFSYAGRTSYARVLLSLQGQNLQWLANYLMDMAFRTYESYALPWALMQAKRKEDQE